VLKRGALMLAGYRDAPMDTVANSLSVLDLGRTMVDRTGLSGRFDYTIEWAPEPRGPVTNEPPPPEGETGLEALRDQLGLKAEATKSRVQILIVDKVERPGEN
jgi:bla regulator protein blaR1